MQAFPALGPSKPVRVDRLVVVGPQRESPSVRSPPKAASNLPSGSDSLSIFVIWLTWPRQHPFGSGNEPGIRPVVPRPSAEGPVISVSVFLAPFGVPAFASWPPGARWGIGPSLRSAYRSLFWPDPNGVATFHTCELRPGWVPSIPRGRWCSHGRLSLFGRHLPHHNGIVPVPRSCFHRPRLYITRHH